MPTLTGGEVVVRMLQMQGVDRCFGMAGFQTLPYYDALARQEQIRHVLIRDEKHGAFAADAFARVTNRPAVADATLGPGATNLVSGAAESYGASIPLLLITGEVNSRIAGRAATQESDQFGMLRPTSKASIRMDRIDRIPELMRKAFNLAVGGRPGPVHLDVPEEVMHGTHDFPDGELYVDPETKSAPGRRSRPDPVQVAQALELISQADRPVAIVGGGIHLSQAYAELQTFVEGYGIPVATTISGKGAISENHPLALGICGRFSRYANEMIKRADAIVVIGSKLGEIATDRWSLISPSQRLVHADIDPAEIGKVYRCNVGLVGDAKLVLADLNASRGPGAPSKKRTELAAEVHAAREAWSRGTEHLFLSDEEPIHVARVLHELRQALPADGIVVADGGFAAHWSGLLFDVTCAGRTYIANRGHAAIGYGLPGAIGAKLAAPDRPVVALCGDNGFAMAVAELETARRAGAPIVVLVLNNETLGYVKALQHNLYKDRFVSVDFLEVDYAAVARGFGCNGLIVRRPAGLSNAIRDAIASDLPTVLDVRITTDPARMLPAADSRTTAAGSRK